MKTFLFQFSLCVLGVNMAFAQNQTDFSLEILGAPLFPAEQGTFPGDTMAISFNIYKDRGMPGETRKLFLKSGENVKMKADEYIDGKKQKPLEYIQGSARSLSKKKGQMQISSSITVSILIDRSGSITGTDMDKIKQAVKSIVDQLPEGTIYYSWFHSDVSSSSPINARNFETANFDTSNFDTDLNNAIYMKLLEFDSTSTVPNESLEPGYQRNIEIARRRSVNNYMIVLTDGNDDKVNIPKYDTPNYMWISEPELYGALAQYSDRVKVFVLGFGESTKYFDEANLKNIARANGNPRGYYLSKPDSVLYLFRDTIMEQLSADYEARFLIPSTTCYSGQERTIKFDVTQPVTASGELTYTKGSKYVVYCVKPQSILTILLYGLVAGLVFFIIVLIVIQLLIPLFKNWLFKIKYVKNFKASPNELKRTCPYCFEEFDEHDPIKERRRIVVKCEHVVHLVCWRDNGHMCPEFTQQCKTGKQDFFDISDPFSRRNKLFYLNWILYGLIGGFFTWLIYVLVRQSYLFDRFSERLVRWLSSPELSNESVRLFVDKIAPLFIVGILMGFFLSLFFAGIEEYRKRSLLVVAKILLRGVIGALVGFVSFLIGNILIILIGQPKTSILIDWIPWLFFGGLIGYSLTIKTTLSWKHGLIGGLFSIIFSFIVIYLITPDIASIAMLIAFMIYGAGLGASIATVRSTAEQYFLEILNGPKQGSQIAIHKWMSAQGGMNEVFIGRSNVCEIQMNWEKKFDIAERHAKVYIQRIRRIPVLVSIQKDKTTLYDERIEMLVGKEYDLMNGTTFKIGETVFKYIEKD